MSGTIKKRCTCVSEYQDKKYGKKIRICNLSLDQKKATCTVCGAVK